MKNKIVLIALISILILPTLVYAARDTETIIEDVDSVREGVPARLVIESDVMHLKQIDFVANRYLGDVQFKIANMNYKPSTASDPVFDVYEYFEIVPGKFTEDDVDSIDITFYILEEWLIYRNHDTSDVVLLRYSGGDWEELDTDFVGKSKQLYTFRSESTGFQFFAIAAPKYPDVIAEEPAISIETPVTTTPTRPEIEMPDKAPLLTIIVVALIVIIAYFAFSKGKRRTTRKKRKKGKK